VKLALALSLAMTLRAAAPEFKVRLGDRVVSMPMERYVAAAIAGESSVFRSPEALRAMAVAARTYAIATRGRHSAEGYDFCSTTHCQRLDVAAITPRIEAAVEATAGQLLWYQGKPVFACYTRDCGGRSEDAAALWPERAAPYLRSHADPYCQRAGSPDATWQWNADPRQVAEALARALLNAPHRIDRIEIESATASARVRTLLLEGAGERVRMAAGSFRLAMGREMEWNTVRSDLYRVHESGGLLVFEGRGSGHGVGLCQHGADQMGVEGKSWRDILAFYYPGTEPGLTARGIHWQVLSGDGVTLATIHPNTDGPLLEAAVRALRAAIDRTRLPAPTPIEMRAYPDIDTFRNATGEPGWVAAWTIGGRIHLQPWEPLSSRGALDGILRHEFLHVLIESQATASLPMWFHEGLVEYLNEPPAASRPVRFPSDGDFEQTTDVARARRAHQDSAAAVASLARRYGEAALFSWLRTGLPAGVGK